MSSEKGTIILVDIFHSKLETPFPTPQTTLARLIPILLLLLILQYKILPPPFCLPKSYYLSRSSSFLQEAFKIS